MYQNFPFQGPPKYTQIGIFGLKINHLATLCQLTKTLMTLAKAFSTASRP
jgi:hypothetical protein